MKISKEDLKKIISSELKFVIGETTRDAEVLLTQDDPFKATPEEEKLAGSEKKFAQLENEIEDLKSSVKNMKLLILDINNNIRRLQNNGFILE